MTRQRHHPASRPVVAGRWRAACASAGPLLRALLLAGGVVLAGVGCAGTGDGGPETPAGLGAQRGDRPRISAAELDELTRAFADRYVGLLSSTCDALKQDNPDPVQRREAQELMLNCATNVYDIASNADAFTRTLDLLVVTTLVSGVWDTDGRAEEVFGDRAELLVRALEHGRAEARELAEQVLAPPQLAVLDALMLEWRRDNPDMTRMASVRFSNFAIGRGKSSTAEVLAARGWFAHVGTAGRSVDEARLLTERMFYALKRQSTILRWEAEAAKDDLFATPEVSTYLRNVDRLTDVAERLPADVSAEREAIVAAVDERMAAVDATLDDARTVLAAADGLAKSVDEAGASLDAMLQSADRVLGRFDKSGATPATQPARAFDVREYTEGVKELASALQNMNEVLKSSDALLTSPAWASRIDEVNRSADARMQVASEQGQRVVSSVFKQLWLTIGGVFALLVLYRLFTHRLARRAGAPAATLDDGQHSPLKLPVAPAPRPPVSSSA